MIRLLRNLRSEGWRSRQGAPSLERLVCLSGFSGTVSEDQEALRQVQGAEGNRPVLLHLGVHLRVGDDWKSMDEKPLSWLQNSRSRSICIQLRSAKLEVCLVGVTDSGPDISLAMMQEEKNRRELPMASYRMWTGINAQLDPKNLIAVDVQKLGDKLSTLHCKKRCLQVNSFSSRWSRTLPQWRRRTGPPH
jgi:hypothetical protein